MAKRATTKCKLSLNLGLLVLLSFLGPAMPEGTDSLSCNFTVQYRSSHGQCSVNGKTVLHFHDERQKSPVCKLEEKGNATELCPHLNQSLKDIFQKMTNLESGLLESKGNHTFRVAVQLKYNQEELMDGYWAFTIDGQTFYFYPKNMTWRESHPDASRTMSQWENDREVAHSLRTCSMGDFSQCLNKLLTDSREMPRSTIKTLVNTQPTSATQIPPTVDSASSVFTTWSQYKFVLILCLAISIIIATVVVATKMKKKVLPAVV